MAEDGTERAPDRLEAGSSACLSLALGSPQAVSKLLKKSRAKEVGVVVHPIAYGFLRCWLADRRGKEIWHVLAEDMQLARYAIAIPLLDELKEVVGVETAS